MVAGFPPTQQRKTSGEEAQDSVRGPCSNHCTAQLGKNNLMGAGGGEAAPDQL